MPPETIIRTVYDRFNARDIEGALALMSKTVQWANGMDGGFVTGHAALETYWRRQWEQVLPLVHPLTIDVSAEDSTVIVLADQKVSRINGELLSETRVRHVFELADGKIVSMTIMDADPNKS